MGNGSWLMYNTMVIIIRLMFFGEEICGTVVEVCSIF